MSDVLRSEHSVTNDQHDPVTEILRQVLARAGQDRSGAVADYIPELADVDPEPFGIAAASVLGSVYTAGDSATTFTIQSISKPFVYAAALADLGVDEVHRHVGFEPSGEPFNAISLDARGRPANPMINAGAIVTSALIEAENPDARFDRIRRVLSDFAGRPLGLDDRVYRSESATGHRNRALAHLARSTGALHRDVDDAVEVYFRQCSLVVTAADLAVMGATLANAGVNPITGAAVVPAKVARHTLSIMSGSGMYDRAGEWAFRVGMPAKSGVGGGIVAVKPGQFGVGVFSPRLDEAGNSARGTGALTMLSHDYGLHLLSHPPAPVSPVRDLRVEAGGRIRVVLRGAIDLIAMEQLVAEVSAALTEDIAVVVVDLAAATLVGPVAADVLRGFAEFDRDPWPQAKVELLDPAGLLG
jgi:glutaminase